MPVGIPKHGISQPGAQRIGHDVTRSVRDVLVAAQGVIVEAASPDRPVDHQARRMQRAGDACLEATYRAPKRLFAKFQQAVPVVGHQHPCKQPGIAPNIVPMSDPAGDSRAGVIFEYTSALPRRGGQQVDLARQRDPPTTQGGTTGSRKDRHADSMPVCTAPKLSSHTTGKCRSPLAGDALGADARFRPGASPASGLLHGVRDGGASPASGLLQRGEGRRSIARERAPTRGEGRRSIARERAPTR